MLTSLIYVQIRILIPCVNNEEKHLCSLPSVPGQHDGLSPNLSHFYSFTILTFQEEAHVQH